MHKVTLVNADRWYDFCSRQSGDDEAADLELLRDHSGDSLVSQKQQRSKSHVWVVNVSCQEYVPQRPVATLGSLKIAMPV